MDTTNNAAWETLTPEEKRRALYDRQVATLKTFLEHGAITQAQHDKSLHDLTEKMGYGKRNRCGGSMILRSAHSEEAEQCYQFIEDARAYHKSLGFVQWHPEYPTLQTVTKDIEVGIGYAFTDGAQPFGYCCIVIGDEPAYHEINGAWKTDRPYAVVHRMAFGAEHRGTGLSRDAFRLIREYCDQHHIHAIRIDTQGENKPMQHILQREGFAYCGTVTFDGGPKLAYELDW